MTVINKLNQTLEMLKSCESNCKTFSMDTDDQSAKQMFTQMADSIKQAEDMLQNRINYVIQQEPQYSPKSQQAQLNNNSQQSTQNMQTSQNIRINEDQIPEL